MSATNTACIATSSAAPVTLGETATDGAFSHMTAGVCRMCVDAGASATSARLLAPHTGCIGPERVRAL